MSVFMQELREFIAKLSQFEADPAQLLKLFSERIHNIYGPCSVALVSKTQLQATQCQVTVYIDDLGHFILNEDNMLNVAHNSPIYDNKHVDEIFSSIEPRFLPHSDPRIKQIFANYFGQYIDVVSFPLLLQGKVEKWMFVLFKQSTPLQLEDIERIWLISTLAINYGFSIDSANQLRQANQWIENELKAVARIQNLLLPQDLSHTPGLKVVADLKPYAQVGGDYYDVTQLGQFVNHEQANVPTNAWGFMIADASGHGSAAAVEIAMFDAILRTYPPDIEAGPAGVFNYVNRYLFTRTTRGSFISAFVSAYLPDQHLLSYCNAGHPAPLLRSRQCANQLVPLNESIGIPLGVIPDGQWQSASIAMEIGDILVLYTDGVIEARSDNGEAFGQERLEQIILTSDFEPQIILKNIQTALLQHQHGSKQNDDQTLLIIQPTI